MALGPGKTPLGMAGNGRVAPGVCVGRFFFFFGGVCLSWERNNNQPPGTFCIFWVERFFCLLKRFGLWVGGLFKKNNNFGELKILVSGFNIVYHNHKHNNHQIVLL